MMIPPQKVSPHWDAGGCRTEAKGAARLQGGEAAAASKP